MTALQRLIFWHCENHLAPYRNAARIVENETPAYGPYLPLIKQQYANATYWHGTGRYHHGHASGSRYEKSGDENIIDVLESILKDGCLAAHKDVWVKVRGEFAKTISLAPSRMHARLYAHIHLYEGVWLKYVFGGTKFWMGFFILLGLRELRRVRRENSREIAYNLRPGREMFRQARAWGSAIRNLDAIKILPLWRAYDLRSDIRGNHPVLLGIRGSVARNASAMPIFSNIEVRLRGSIPLSQVTHIEVPLEYVGAAGTLLERHGVNLPIIPLEFGELYCSQLPLMKLAHV
jgi:hypothetical protein